MITTPIMGDFLLAQRGSDIPIPRTPAQGRLANTSSEEPQNTPLGRHIAFEIPSPAPCFAEGEEEEDGDDENGGANTATGGERGGRRRRRRRRTTEEEGEGEETRGGSAREDRGRGGGNGGGGGGKKTPEPKRKEHQRINMFFCNFKS